MKHLLIILTMMCLNLIGAPIRIISPADVSRATFIISTTGTYIFSDDLLAAANPAISITSSNVVLDMNGRTLFGSTANNGINVANAGNITIRNGSLSNFSTGINIDGASGASNVLVDSVMIQNCAGSGFLLAACQEITIRNCMSTGNAGAGINVQSGRDILIDNCSFVTNGGRGINVGTVTTATVTVNNCVMACSGDAGIVFVTAADSVIQNSTAFANTQAGIQILPGTVRSIMANSYSYANLLGFVNESATSGVIGSMAFSNTTTNYSGAGPFSAISVNRNSQLAQGAVTDIRYDNLAIT
jgi:hypothetical protein